MNEKNFYELLSIAEKTYLEGKFFEAEKRLIELLKEKPLDVKSNELLGLVYVCQDKNIEAIGRLEIAAEDKNISIYAQYKLAMLYMQKEAYESAINTLLRLHKATPESLDIILELANAYLVAERYGNALHWLHMANARSPRDKEILYNIGRIYDETSDLSNAINYYKKSLEVDSKFVQPIINIGTIYLGLKDYQNAIDYLKIAYKISPNYDYLIGDIIFCMKNLCMWAEEDDFINKLYENNVLNHKAIFPFQYLAIKDSPKNQLAIAKSYNDKFEDIATEPIRDEYKKNQKIKIAYVSGDFKSHPIAHLMAEVFELHDRNRFEIFAFSLSALNQNDPMTLRLKNAFDKFHDLSKKTDVQIYDLARKSNLTIAVDLMGHTACAKTSLFAKRIAPVQINYLGYPGTMGAKFIDYIVADKNLIPSEQREYYSEKIIYMPQTYQPFDNKKIISNQLNSKDAVNLPQDKFIFCCFNSMYKINKKIFSTWIEILDLVPESVLWLCTDDEIVIKNLRNSMVEGNMDSRRLIFSKPRPYGEYLEMYKFADLFLDTAPFNAGTTARDALYCGVPVLTIEGKSFAGRMASSLLRAINMNTLITKDLKEYKSTAIKLATSHQDYKEIKLSLNINKSSNNFCSKEYVKNLEIAYKKISETSLINEKHNDLYI
jgi:predicted O-linked N-acetylglucosamine transferase (SPINDLY family)